MEDSYIKINTLDFNKIKIPTAINLLIISLIFFVLLMGEYYFSFSEFVQLIIQQPVLLLIFPVLLIVYIVLHEFIHGFFMRKFSGIKPRYGHSGPFIFAESDAYFNKNPYIILALAPMVILGIVTVIAFFFVPNHVMWFNVFIAVINLYLSRGDLQAVILLKDISSDYFIKDAGDSISIYSYK